MVCRLSEKLPHSQKSSDVECRRTFVFQEPFSKAETTLYNKAERRFL